MNKFLMLALMMSASSAYAALVRASDTAAAVAQSFRGSDSSLELSVLLFGAAVILVPILLIWWALKSTKPPRR